MSGGDTLGCCCPACGETFDLSEIEKDGQLSNLRGAVERLIRERNEAQTLCAAHEREQIAAWLEERARGIHEREQEAESKGARVGSSAAAVALSLVAGQIRNGAHADGDKHSDSDRLDWLERENGRIGWNGREWVAFRSGRSNLRETGSRTGTGKTLREAIDAVMRKEKA